MTSLVHHRSGSGAPLVLIHGLGSHWQVWSPVLDDLARHRDVIALDLPGFGDSPLWAPPAGRLPGSVPHLADVVSAFLDDLGLDTPEIAGSSLGGGIALELGRRGRARAVTAFAPVGFWRPPGRAWCSLVVGGGRSLARALAPLLPGVLASPTGRTVFCAPFYGRPRTLPPPDALAGARALAGAPGFPAARAAFRRLTPWSPAALAALAAVPVTIAWGTRDAVLPYRAQSRRARTLLPTARHVPLRGCGHLPFADDPARCVDLLLTARTGG
ncbi:alpha/beta fold hydrolase [Actinoplanes sp. NPDC051851]|uniref:alpha/beta fold hydrolase n=1 Tax=Actinoplanes sp. NPDC051851 TaxID=3154753 RepID=UPI0034379861